MIRRALHLASWLVLAAAFALPIVLALAASLSPSGTLAGAGWHALTLAHYRALFAERGFLRPIESSLVVATMTTALCLVVGFLCAYALARMSFPGRRLLLGGILALSMFPQITIVAPLYLVLRALHLVDTYPGLVLPYLTFAMPLTVWLLVGQLRALPPELEQAARIDGAGRLRTIVEVVLPLSWPGLVTTGILTFVYCWNEFLFALSFTLGTERWTVPVAIALFQGRYQIPWGEILAGAVVATLPVALLVLVFQRRIVRGITAGAVKG